MNLNYFLKNCRACNYYGDDPDIPVECHWDYLVTLQKIRGKK